MLFKGTIAGQPQSLAYVAFSSTGLINGFVEGQNGQNYLMATLADDLKAGDRILTVRKPSGLGMPEIPFCGTEYDPSILEQFEKSAAVEFTSAGPRLMRVAIDADQKFVDIFGTTYEARDYVVQLIGAISAIYVRDFDVRLTLAYARLWPSGGEPFNPHDLSSFRDYWVSNEDTTGLNLVHMWSGARNTSYGGVAYYSNTCNGFGYGIDALLNGSFLAPVTSPDMGNWDVNVTAHEMGHNCGSPHTHDDFFSPLIDACGNGTPSRGTIMSYCHTHAGYQRNIDLHMHRRVEQYVVTVLEGGGCHPRDCNGNNRSDAVDIALAFSNDVNSNGIPDECEDCNNNSILDPADIAGGMPDVDGNGIPDACETDCNGNSQPDRWETWQGFAADDDGNNVPDGCDPDCNGNTTLDFNELNFDLTLDLDRNRVLDECQDCNSNFLPDWQDMNRQYNLFVSDFSANSVKEFHALSGVTVQTYAGTTSTRDVISDNAGTYLFIAEGSRVSRLLVATGTVSVFISSGTGGLSAPSALTLMPGGDLLVADNSGNAIRRYNSTTGATLGDFVASGASPLTGPWGTTYGPNGNLFVTSNNNAVYQYNGTTGAYIGQFVAPGSGGLSGPRGLLFLSTGNLVVASFNTHQILEYNGSTGAFIGQWDDEFGVINPWGMRIGPNGNLFVAGFAGSQGRVLEYFEPEGRYYRSFVRGSGIFSLPTGLAFLPGSSNDVNGNWVLDACEPGDMDSDGITNINDNCPSVSNSAQTDSDSDGDGDACDNCPATANADQRDVDADGKGDECDNCPAHANASQTDGDSDGRGDVCDNCPSQSNANQADADGDAIGDLCDMCPNDFRNDGDTDGFCADVDNCPAVYNPGQEDADFDGIGDVCEIETYDTVFTPCLALRVGSRGNAAHNTPTVSLDYWDQGDCEATYLYTGSPILVYDTGSGKVIHHDLYDRQAGRLPDLFTGKPTVGTVDSAAFQIYQSGTFVSPDHALAIEKVWYAPKQFDSCQFVIQCLRVYSGDGGTHTGVAIGEAMDWDIPNVGSSANTGGFNSAARLVYLRGSGFGCQDNTRRYGGQSLIGVSANGTCVDTSATPYGALTESNTTYMYPLGSPFANDMYTLMQQPGYSTLVSSEDQFALITYENAQTIGPTDTLYFYTMLSTIRNGVSGDLVTNVGKAKRWLLNHVRPACGAPSCCVPPVRGNVDGITGPGGDIDVSDLTFLVAYLFSGGSTPPCIDEGNVDGIDGPAGPIDVADLTYLVAYLFQGGSAPALCP